jgi:hypothetical protein
MSESAGVTGIKKTNRFFARTMCNHPWQLFGVIAGQTAVVWGMIYFFATHVMK